MFSQPFHHSKGKLCAHGCVHIQTRAQGVSHHQSTKCRQDALLPRQVRSIHTALNVHLWRSGHTCSEDLRPKLTLGREGKNGHHEPACTVLGALGAHCCVRTADVFVLR